MCPIVSKILMPFRNSNSVSLTLFQMLLERGYVFFGCEHMGSVKSKIGCNITHINWFP